MTPVQWCNDTLRHCATALSHQMLSRCHLENPPPFSFRSAPVDKALGFRKKWTVDRISLSETAHQRSIMESGLEVRPDTETFPEPCNNVDKEAAQDHAHRSFFPTEHHALGNSTEGNYHREERRSDARGQKLPIFGLLVALVTAVVVGGAVGGGLGGALYNANQDSPTATITVTSTLSASTSAPPASTTTGGLLLNYSAAAPTSIYSVADRCPDADGAVYTAMNEQTWAISCKHDQYSGDLGAILDKACDQSDIVYYMR